MSDLILVTKEAEFIIMLSLLLTAPVLTLLFPWVTWQYHLMSFIMVYGHPPKPLSAFSHRHKVSEEVTANFNVDFYWENISFSNQPAGEPIHQMKV